MDIGKDLQKAYNEGYADGKADAVRKVKDKITMRFGTYTEKDMTPIVELFRMIDQIAEETIGEGNG